MRKIEFGFVLLLATVLIASSTIGYLPSPVKPASAQAQLSRDERNWEYINHDLSGTNHNPQTQLNKQNVQLLELKWLYPYGPPPVIPGLTPGGNAGGSMTPALVVDGIAYVVTNFATYIALNLETGKVVWSTTVPYNSTELTSKYPHVRPVNAKKHAVNYYADRGILIGSLTGCQLDAIDALTGKIKFQVKELCGTFEEAKAWGHQSFYRPNDHPPVFFGNIMVVPVGGSSGGGGRTFVSGYDISDTSRPRKVWQTFLAPPAQGDAEWALRECDKGRFAPGLADRAKGILAVPCKDVPRDVLLNDWADPVAGTGQLHTGSAVSSFWGHYPLDPETGIVYIGTGEIGSYWNATRRYGPNLYGSSIVALDARTGKMVWWFADNPHDMWDMDCAWNVILGKIGNRKVVLKSCKAGVYRAFDAATGEVLWAFDPPSIWRPAHAPIYGLDPKSKADMSSKWPQYPKTTDVLINGGAQGVQESDMAYDGKKIYIGPFNRPQRYTILPVPATGNTGGGRLPDLHPLNTTIWGVDATTGKPAWSFFVPANTGLRGGIAVSGGVVYVVHPDGNLYMLDADSGKLLANKYLSTASAIQATIGATASGKMRVLVQTGGGGTFGTNVGGALLIYGLPDKIPEPQVVTKEVIKEVPRDVIKEVVKEVPKEVIKEVVKEVPKEVVREVVKEVPKEVTKTVTVETISPITYVGIGLGIIIAVVGIVISRRKAA